jgi:hypothetical protein
MSTDVDGEAGTHRAIALSVAQSNGAILTIPPESQLTSMRENAKRNGTLKDLHKMLAALEAVAAKCNVAHEEFVRLAVSRLEVERDLGTQLAQTVRRGGDRSKSPRTTLLRDAALPEGITKHQARKYRALATIPEEVFRSYLARAHEERRVPSAAGARRFAAPAKPKARRAKPKKQAETTELPPALLDAISRIMTPDVCVGPAKLAAKACVAVNAKDVLEQLHGDVVVLDCPDPEKWLAELRRSRSKGRVQQIIAVLPAEVWAGWFRELREAEWSMCFLEGVRTADGVGRLAAHHGVRASAFRVAFAHVGVVM